jgi:hypothetical protein
MEYNNEERSYFLFREKKATAFKIFETGVPLLM